MHLEGTFPLPQTSHFNKRVIKLTRYLIQDDKYKYSDKYQKTRLK